MVSPILWSFILILVIGVADVFGNSNVQQPALSEADMDLIQAFQGLLQKALGPEGTYHRHLLISSGIVPAPENYVVPKDNGSGKPEEKPLTKEIYEHFKRHIADIITSEEKLFIGINRLFKEHGAIPPMSNEEITVATVTKSDKDSTVARVCSTKKRPFRKNTKMSSEFIDYTTPDSSCDENSQVSENNPSAINYDTKENKQSVSSSAVSGTTSGYLKFLTDGMPSSNLEESEQHMKEGRTDEISKSVPPLTEDFISFLKINSFQYQTSPENPTSGEKLSKSSSTQRPRQPRNEGLSAQTTQFVPLTPEYIDFMEGQAITTTILIPETESESFESQSESEKDSSFMAYSPVSGELLTVETVQLINEPVFSTSDELKYTLDRSSVESSTSMPATESNFFQFEKTEPVRRRHAKEVNHDGDSSSHAAPSLFLVRGTPGHDFPEYDDIPNTTFTCDNKKHIPGFYADEETRCQVFHVCWPGRRESFLCPVGTTFNQAILACDYWYYSNCSISAAYHDVNTAFKETELAKTGSTGPMVDTLIKVSQRAPEVKPEVVSSSKDTAELYEADVHFSETMAKHDLSQIWKFLPIKAKIYIQPQPDLAALLRKAKSKRSKDGNVSNPSSDSEETAEDSGPSEQKASKKEIIETVILNVLRSLAPSLK